MSKHDLSELYQLQGLSLNEKIERTQARIRQWVEHWGEDHVYVSFSGGKDSTVLLDIARKMYPNMKAVFLDTSLEYPELRQFVNTFENVEYLKPKKNFRQVIEEYGYPVISKEVSECVYGARIYLTKLIQEASLDRQTDRQTDRQPYYYSYRKLCGIGEYENPQNTRGGDNKFRRLCGLGCYSKDVGEKGIRQRRVGSETSTSDGVHDSRPESKGEYP